MEHTNYRRPFVEIIHTIATALDAKYVNFLEASSVAPGPAVTSNRFLIDTGVHACKEWRNGDNVRLVMIADNIIDTFWAVVKERLELSDDFQTPKSRVLELSDPALARGGNVHPAVNEIIQSCKKSDCKFYLHYCKAKDATEMSQLRAESNGSIKEDFLFGNVAHNRAINMVNDMRTLAHKVTQRGGNSGEGVPKQLSQTYRSLRHWAKSNGFFGPGFGYFDSMTLFWLAYNAYIDEDDAISIKTEGNEDEQSPTHLTLTMRAFHKLKSIFSGAANPRHLNSLIIDVCTANGQLTTEHITAEAKYNIHLALANTPLAALLQENDVSSRDGDDDPTTALARHRENFLIGFPLYFVFEGESWAQSARDLEALGAKTRQGMLEKAAYLSSSEGLAMHGDDYPRVWPDVLSEKGQEGWVVYAIGLRRGFVGFDAALLEAATALPDISAAITARIETSEELLRRLRPAADSRGVLTGSDTAAPAAAPATLPAGPAIWAPGAALPPRPFRTASSAISRLRHDPAHAGIIYDVGYEDRFAGLVTMPLEEWGRRATEEEDWVPEHRVRVLTRRWDGFVVWDREGRVDRTGEGIDSAFPRAWEDRLVI